jgi:hypothetical protein
MDASKVVFLINDQVRLIRVTYEKDDVPVLNSSKREYCFKTMDQAVQVGDYVVVETSTRHGLTVCQVSAVDLDVDFDDGVALKWAFQRVDSENVKSILASEEEAVAAAKRAELKRKRIQLRGEIFAEHGDMIAGLSLATKTLPAE